MPAVEARLVEKLVADRIIRLGRSEGRQDLKKLLNICLAFVEQNHDIDRATFYLSVDKVTPFLDRRLLDPTPF